MTVQPGPGEPAPSSGPRAGRTERQFRESVTAWAAAGTERSWQVQLADIPPPGVERQKVYAVLHRAWSREMDRQGFSTGRGGSYTASLVPDGDGGWLWKWGPKDDG